MSSSAASVSSPAVTLAEVAEIIHRFPPLQKEEQPETPYGDWRAWLSQSSGHCLTHERVRLRVALFAGAHGCTPDSSGRAKAGLAAFSSGQEPSLGLLKAIDADLRVYELDVETPTADFRTQNALSDEAAAHAMAYGMMAIEPNIDLVGFAALETGGEAAYMALSLALEETPPQQALSLVARFGGEDVAAIIGGIIAARLGHVPVLVAGPAALCAMKVLEHMGGPEAVAHVRAASDLEPNLASLSALSLALGRLKLISHTSFNGS